MLSNKDFLQSVFNSPNETTFCWITAFQQKPTNGKWSGNKVHASQCEDFPSQNSYFSTALFDEKSKSRTMKQAKGLYCIVLDDLGTSTLRPTWRLETSQDNYQLGFALSEAITDMDLAERLMKEITNKSLINGNDRSGNNAVRYVRLPVGINNKDGTNFSHNMVEWNDALKYSLEQIISELNLDATFIYNRKSNAETLGTKEFGQQKDYADLVRQVIESEHFYDPLLKLTASLVARGTERNNALAIAEGIMQGVPNKPADWNQYYKQIPSMVDGAVAKFSAKTIEAGNQKYGDIYNGKVFSEMFKGTLIYCHSNKSWLQWNGNFWKWCNANEQDVLAKEAAKQIGVIAGEFLGANPTDPDAKLAFSNARQIINNNKRADMLMAATTEQGMHINSISDLDANPMFLGCQNGVIDLKAGTLLTPDPQMLISKCANVIFDRTAECPSWINFLNEALLNDKNTIQYIQKALGYSLTGDVSEELVHFCSGFGRNGKTLFTNVIYTLMGDYSIVVDTDILMRSDQQSASSPTPEIVRLQGKRFAVANEIEEGRRLNDKHLKILASKQAITARDMYSKPIDFMPQHKIWVTTNHHPTITDQTDGAWRRLRIIPFRYQVSLDKIDYKLEDKLLEEKSGILNWLLEGCKLWLKDRLDPSNAILDAVEAYKKESDTIGLFIDECCQLASDFTVTKNMLYQRFRTWCYENSHHPCSKINFTKKLTDRGISKARTSSDRMYLGIKMSQI